MFYGYFMTLLYVLSGYNSHNRAGKAYCKIISEHYSSAQDLNGADVVILHLEPHDYGSIYRNNPALKNKYVRSRCVWEADDLPDSYKHSLSYVQEVWTPSHYCKAVFSRNHPRVMYMPHAVNRDMTCSDTDRVLVRRMINYSEECVYYLTVTKLWDRRKNTKLLVEAFQNQGRRMPNARLIIKASPRDKGVSFSDPRIIVLCV